MKMHFKMLSAKWRPFCPSMRVETWHNLKLVLLTYFKMRSAKWQLSLQWRNNGRDSASNHQPHDCLLNRLFRCGSKKTTSNGSWCIGIKGEMSGTVCVTFTWDIYIYIWVVYSFCLFCRLFIIVTWWYMWCIVWQVASKRKYRHVW